eukprot:gene22786-biopygen19280
MHFVQRLVACARSSQKRARRRAACAETRWELAKHARRAQGAREARAACARRARRTQGAREARAARARCAQRAREGREGLRRACEGLVRARGGLADCPRGPGALPTSQKGGGGTARFGSQPIGGGGGTPSVWAEFHRLWWRACLFVLDCAVLYCCLLHIGRGLQDCRVLTLACGGSRRLVEARGGSRKRAGPGLCIILALCSVCAAFCCVLLLSTAHGGGGVQDCRGTTPYCTRGGSWRLARGGLCMCRALCCLCVLVCRILLSAAHGGGGQECRGTRSGSRRLAVARRGSRGL